MSKWRTHSTKYICRNDYPLIIIYKIHLNAILILALTDLYSVLILTNDIINAAFRHTTLHKRTQFNNGVSLAASANVRDAEVVAPIGKLQRTVRTVCPKTHHKHITIKCIFFSSVKYEQINAGIISILYYYNAC